MKNENESVESQPFFVRYLEPQDYPEVQTGVKAGRPPFHTLKYPSDNEEGGDTV